MSFPQVVLLGYYGFGNFGDDLLLRVTHRITRELRPKADIAVRATQPARYFERLLQSEVKCLPFGTGTRHDLLIHGGGGTFFDFSRYGLAPRIRNRLALSLGTGNFVCAEARLRELVRRPRLSGDVRVGLGIGIGKYSSGSPKLLEALPILQDFDALWLRDLQSQRNLMRLNASPPVVLGSDLVFLMQHWCPPALRLHVNNPRPARPRVALLLRDWKVGDSTAFVDVFSPIVERMNEVFELTLVSLNPEHDSGVIGRWRSLPQLHWLPHRQSVAEFAEALAKHDVVVTSRAHGAICGACLGRPSVILEIEPKLRTIHEMLPNGTRLVSPPFESNAVMQAINEVLDIPIDSVVGDVIYNEQTSSKALNVVLEQASL